MKRMFLLLLALLTALSASAGMAEGDGVFKTAYDENYTLYYMTAQDALSRELSALYGKDVAELQSIRLTDENASWKELNVDVRLVIPPEVDGHPVVGLGPNALSNLIIPGKITSITLPDSLCYMHPNALDCPLLTEIIVSEEHPVYQVVNGALCNKQTRSLVRYPGARPDESFAIPDGILTVDEGAFDGAKNLRTLVIPDSVTTIPQGTLQNSIALTSVHIGSGVTVLPYQGSERLLLYVTQDPSAPATAELPPFCAFPEMQSITVSPDNPAYSSIDGVLFDKAGATLLCYPMARRTDVYVVPDSVTAIDADAFITGPAAIRLPDSFLFTEGAQTEMPAYPEAMTDELMQALISVDGLSSKNRRTIQDSYKKVDPARYGKSMDVPALESRYPALKDGTVIWVERNALSGLEMRANAKEKLLSALTAAGCTAEVIAAEYERLGAPLVTSVIECAQLAPHVIPTNCALVVEPDSLAYRWAKQNGYPVVLTD